MIEPRALTVRQARVLETITRYTRATGEPCPGSYLARHFDVHHSTIQEYLTALHRKGWLRGPSAPAQPRRWLARARRGIE